MKADVMNCATFTLNLFTHSKTRRGIGVLGVTNLDADEIAALFQSLPLANASRSTFSTRAL